MTRQIISIAAYTILLSAILFAALTPGAIGEIVEDGPTRHILAFTTLSIAAICLWPNASLVAMWIGISTFGGTIELLQGAMKLGRQADWADLGLDMVAASAAFALCILMRPLAMRMISGGGAYLRGWRNRPSVR